MLRTTFGPHRPANDSSEIVRESCFSLTPRWLVFSLVSRCQGLLGPTKYTSRPVAQVSPLLAARFILRPQVRDLRTSSGRSAFLVDRASATVTVSRPSSRTNTVKRDTRMCISLPFPLSLLHVYLFMNSTVRKSGPAHSSFAEVVNPVWTQARAESSCPIEYRGEEVSPHRPRRRIGLRFRAMRILVRSTSSLDDDRAQNTPVGFVRVEQSAYPVVFKVSKPKGRTTNPLNQIV